MDSINISNFLYDSLSLIMLFAIFVYFKYFQAPFETGFYCTDHTIGLPYKSSTVPNVLLLSVSVVLPIVVFLGTEVVRTFYMKNKNLWSAPLHLRNRYKIIISRKKFIEMPEQIGNILINYFNYFYGLLIVTNLTNIGKKSIGRLRPNFLSVCKPNEDPYGSICKSNDMIGYHAKYYVVPGVDFNCTGDKKDVSESRLSFPSGHASTAFYTAIFLILYVNRTWSKRNLSFVAQFFQFLLFASAFYTGLSRVTDNKHHWSDVLAGSLLGTLVATFKFYYLHLFFKRYNYKIKYESPGAKSIETNEINNYTSNRKNSGTTKTETDTINV